MPYPTIPAVPPPSYQVWCLSVHKYQRRMLPKFSWWNEAWRHEFNVSMATHSVFLDVSIFPDILGPRPTLSRKPRRNAFFTSDLDLTWSDFLGSGLGLDLVSFLRERTWTWLDLMQSHADLDLRLAGLAHHWTDNRQSYTLHSDPHEHMHMWAKKWHKTQYFDITSNTFNSNLLFDGDLY